MQLIQLTLSAITPLILKSLRHSVILAKADLVAVYSLVTVSLVSVGSLLTAVSDFSDTNFTWSVFKLSGRYFILRVPKSGMGNCICTSVV